MKRVVVILVLVIVLSLIGIVSAECTDSDDGEDYSTKGTVDFNNTNYTDSCSGDDIIEYFCENDLLNSTTTSCPEGEICDDGACVEEDQNDTDGEVTRFSNKDFINETISEYFDRLEGINAELDKYDAFTKDSIEAYLDLDPIETELEDIQTDFLVSTSEDDYRVILGALSEMEIPRDIYISKKGNSLSYYTSKGKMDLYILEEIGGDSIDESDHEKYSNAILAWNQKNIDMKLSFKEFYVAYEDYREPIVNIFELNVEEKGEWYETPYLVIEELDDLEFKKNYNEVEGMGYVYIDLADISETIVFSTTESIEFHELPIFVSPRLSDLEIKGDVPPAEEKKTKWIWFIIVLLLLLISGAVIYIVLQRWYDERYESHLFKSKNDLYNLVLYIQNEKRKGLTDNEILKKIKKAGWTGEQARYVTRKYVGKRTGMYKIFPSLRRKIKKPTSSPATRSPSRRIPRRGIRR